MKQLLIDIGDYTLEVEVADNVDLDDRFQAKCLETGEQLWINGWLIDDVTDITEAGTVMSDDAERAHERRALGGEC